jgi:hypothetical protein
MRSTTRIAALGALLALASASACKATQQRAVFEDGGGADGQGTGQGAGNSEGGSGGTGGDVGPIGTGGGATTTAAADCTAGDNEDRDHDGFTKALGDCNDCDASVNPNAVEVIAVPDENGVLLPPADEDCDGAIDNVPTTCDTGLALDSQDPMDAAKAVDLCPPAHPQATWGVKNAQWVRADGNPALPGGNNFHLGHGILNGFGGNVNVQGGSSFLVLSSGTARTPGQPGYQSPGGFDKGYTGPQPDTGFPKESPACSGAKTGEVHDDTALELTIQTPSNAQGFAFMFNFFTYEWPDYICSTFNDFFVAILKPNLDGFTDGNISFDSQGNAVSVNNGLLEVCGPPGNYGNKDFACPLGVAGLQGTGFEASGGFLDSDHGSTYWLATQAPVVPNTEIHIRWAVYDSGDGVLDSTTIIDNWQWIASSGTQVGTGQVPDPH